MKKTTCQEFINIGIQLCKQRNSNATNKYHHNWGRVKFDFCLKSHLVLNVINLTWLTEYNKMSQNRDTNPKPNSIILGMLIQFNPMSSYFILNLLEFCLWGKRVGLGENI